MLRHLGLAAAVLTLGLAAPATADYPDRSIRVIVPWGAGGGTDVTIRGFLDVAEAHVGTSFNVTNVTGGSGAVGWGEAARARADGYNLVALTYDLLAITAKNGPADYQDFVPLVTISQYPQVFAVAADSPIETFDDFIALARDRDEPVTVAMGGLGGIHHLAAVGIEQAKEVELRAVPFQGGAPSIAALLGGNVDATFTDVPEAKGRPDIRVLVQFASERHPDMPDVPTAIEEGMDIVLSSFRSLGAPVGTPDDVVAFLRERFDAAWHSDAFQTWSSQANVAPSYMSGEDTQAMFDAMMPVISEALARLDM